MKGKKNCLYCYDICSIFPVHPNLQNVSRWRTSVWNVEKHTGCNLRNAVEILAWRKTIRSHPTAQFTFYWFGPKCMCW